MSQTKILKCSCIHKFQDSIYGSGMRVHNFGLHAHNKTPGFRCTVCLKSQPITKDDKNEGFKNSL
jgi:hypothetical protein